MTSNNNDDDNDNHERAARMSNRETASQPLEPIIRLPTSSPVASLAFLSSRDDTASSNDDEDLVKDDKSSSDSSSSSDEELNFRCSTDFQHDEQEAFLPSNNSINSNISNLLLSCHKNGTLQLWNVQQQQQLVAGHSFVSRNAPGLAVRRMQDRVLYQTRDGIVSVHSYDGRTLAEYETYSHTFCQAAPCNGGNNLIAVPSRNESTATVIDIRSSVPIFVLPIQNHGMLTSLALCSTARQVTLACGMESGTVLFHDFTTKTECKVSSDNQQPVLTLDITESSNNSTIAIAGMADNGGIATIVNNEGKAPRIRQRLSTSSNKPGVSICRFRPNDGRLFAVGGWDRRVRIFDRLNGNLMALLKGSSGSIAALDWSPDAKQTGLLATAAADENEILIWRCFSDTRIMQRPI